MHLHVCRIHSILDSGTILEQSSSSLSPSCVIYSEQWWLFRKASLASSTELEALVYSSDICNVSSFQNSPQGLARWKKVEDLLLRSQRGGSHYPPSLEGYDWSKVLVTNEFLGYKKEDLVETYENFRSIDEKNSPATIFFFLFSKGSALFDLLESFLTTKSLEALRTSNIHVGAFYVLFWLIEFVIFLGLGCVFFSEQWWLFKKATLASSTELKALVYSSDICNGSSFQSWETIMDALISMHMELRKSYEPEEYGIPSMDQMGKT
ncbi:hypothetical protein H5410_061198 [Solanum commersonii]|uniref:Uncharacterized protein n=1 Tax=Solanum commersonii TaxID=4109 RepID=A0A9J5W8F0_SOLCO|nr:hypothetical protein H5410_061198 [Solanum commersonii]